MKVIDPRIHLLVLSGSKHHFDYCRYNMDVFSYYNPKKIIQVGSRETCRGLRNVDILFVSGWWVKRDINDILAEIDIYFRLGYARILGEERFVPPVLWKEYKMMDNRNNELQEINNRFEILDL